MLTPSYALSGRSGSECRPEDSAGICSRSESERLEGSGLADG